MDITELIPQRFASRLGLGPSGIEYGPIGVDIGTRGLRLAQFYRQDGEMDLSNSVFVPYPDPETRHSGRALQKLLKNSIRRHNFIGGKAVSCMPDVDTSIFMLNYLLTADKDDESIITQRMQERLDGDISDFIIDYMLVRPEGGIAQERSALVAVADQEMVIRHLELLRHAGLEVTALEIEPMAIRRLISVRYLNRRIANLLCVSIGKQQTFLTILSGRRLIYEREIEFGELHIVRYIAESLEVATDEANTLMKKAMSSKHHTGSDDDTMTGQLYDIIRPLFTDLVNDINKALIYAASETRGMEVEHIYFTGSVSRMDRIIGHIQDMVAVPTSILLPLDGFDYNDAYDNDTRDTVATGLALRGMTEAN